MSFDFFPFVELFVGWASGTFLATGGQDFGVSATSLLRLRQQQSSVQVSQTLLTPQVVVIYLLEIPKLQVDAT
ncbi:hypothetical protein [Nostoc sp.]|uniref:hypothetical protein n=1 Tax=Nostoc sp. TaxID=1180 RepID=UPI002FF47A70